MNFNSQTNYIVVKAENHLFLKMFPLRIVIDDKKIYSIKGKQSTIAEIESNNCNIEINNGLHFTKKIPVSFSTGNVVGVRVETYFSDGRLLGVLTVWFALFLASFIEGVSILRWLALIPVLVIFAYAIFYKDKIILLSNLHDKSYADKYYDEYDNIIRM